MLSPSACWIQTSVKPQRMGEPQMEGAWASWREELPCWPEHLPGTIKWVRNELLHKATEFGESICNFNVVFPDLSPLRTYLPETVEELERWEVAIDQRKLKITCPLCLGSSRPEIPGELERRARPGAPFLYIDPVKCGPVLPGSHQSKSSCPPLGAAVREQVLILTLPEGRGEIKSLFSWFKVGI